MGDAKAGDREWKIRFDQAVYADAASHTHINNSFSEKFGVKVGDYQGSVLSPLLFVIAMEALSKTVDVDTQGNFYIQMICL